ncbi:MAG: hypothetical protein OHK0021_19200 [Bryobacter sp.]
MIQKDFSEHEVRAALDRIASSPSFDRASRSLQLLRYVVEELLAGRDHLVKEYSIAEAVFERPDYDPKSDSLVRVEASKLRQRLAAYFAAEGAADPLLIQLPKGRYVPVITRAQIPPESTTIPPRRTVVWTAAILGAAAAFFLVYLLGQALLPSIASPGPTRLAVHTRALAPALQSAAERLDANLAASLAGNVRIQVVAPAAADAIVEVTLEPHQTGQRAVVQLERASDRYRIWTHTWTSTESQETFSHEVAGAIDRTLRDSLTPVLRALRVWGTTDRDAWHFYVKGLVHQGIGEHDEAVAMFRAAIAKDSRYAFAHAGLARSSLIRAEWLEEGPEAWSAARLAAGRALALDSSALVVQQAWAETMAYVDRDWAAAEAAFRRAIEIDPTDVELRYGLVRLVLSPLGRLAAAESELRSALALSPHHKLLWQQLTFLRLRQNRAQSAFEAASRFVALSPDSPAAYILRGMALLELGQSSSALEDFARFRSDWSQSLTALALAREGKSGLARQLLPNLRDPCRRAAVLLVLGERDAAFSELQTASIIRPSTTLWMAVDPYLASLHGEPRFLALCRTLRLQN